MVRTHALFTEGSMATSLNGFQIWIGSGELNSIGCELFFSDPGPGQNTVSATPPLTTYRRDWIIIMKVSRNNWWNSFWIINILFSFQTSGQIAFPWILPDKYREGDNSHALRTALELQKKFLFLVARPLTPPPLLVAWTLKENFFCGFPNNVL